MKETRNVKDKKTKQKETTIADLQRVTIWELVDRGNGKPRFERITPW